MTEMLSPSRRRLLYRATHRGFKEADLVFGHFAAAKLAGMTDAEEAEFARLLDVPDQDLYAWVVGRADAPEDYKGPVLEQLKVFDVSVIINGS
ncbi:MAG: succinate dehydrogenase assembly factor 2 [Pseudomonadota bacterium]